MHNCLGALYMLATALAVEVAFECQPALIAERVAFYREKAVGCYGAGSYLAAQVSGGQASWRGCGSD